MEQPSGMYFKIKKKFCIDLLNKLSPFIKEGDKIVEIGPGQGDFAIECNDRKLDYIGIEPSDALRNELKKKGINVKVALVPPIPVEDECCDLLIASAMLEHLPSHVEAIKFANEINRVLKKGKCVCIIVPNYITSKEYFYEMDYTHSYITTKIRVTNLLRDAGLSVVDVQHIMGWFWVESSFFHNVLRHVINVLMVPVHWGITTWFCKYLGMEVLLWKVRKTFVESIIVTAQKQ